jgi:amino acid transporter
MTFARSIGRWALTGLVINCIIGSGIFGVPGELNRLLGRASPIAMIVGALAVAFIIAPTAEVASQFSEPGGAYLYARSAFGRFAGLQVGWFQLLAIIAATAANANLFVVYLAGFLPRAGHGLPRVLFLSALVCVPAVVNYFGARSGAGLSSVLVVAKLLPLVLLIVVGVARFGRHFALIHFAEITAPGVKPWLLVLVLMIFSYTGFEYAIIPSGEVKNPRRTLPFALAASILLVMVVYTLLQFVTVATIGTSASARPVAEIASVLLGHPGAILIGIAVLVSTGGFVSSVTLHGPRLAYSMAAQGEFPRLLGRLHPRFRTPHVAIAGYAALVWLLAVTGGFLWAVVLNVAASAIVYASICGALIQLRRQSPHADALRVPLGRAIAAGGIFVSAALLTQLDRRGTILMCATAIVAAANWWVTQRRAAEPRGI